LITGNKTVLEKGFSVRRFENGYKTTDLFLDLSVYPDGKRYLILEEDEFEKSLKENWIDEKLAQKASRALTQITDMVKNDEFPPLFVKEYANNFKA
jgi:predicted RNA-binding protein associated with RNAse of E/G family